MYRATPFFFAALLGAAIWAFWASYFFPKRYEADWHVHLHGVAMFLWMLMLVVQSTLASRGHFQPHRALGKTSFVLVPVIAASTLMLAHYRMKAGLNQELIYFFYVQVALVAQFLVAYFFAIMNRRTPQVHMRFMVCTALALVDPILARIIYAQTGILPPLLQVLTYGATDLILVALIVHDRMQRHYSRAYEGMLAFFVVTQLPTFFLTGTKEWIALTKAFAKLPLP